MKLLLLVTGLVYFLGCAPFHSEISFVGWKKPRMKIDNTMKKVAVVDFSVRNQRSYRVNQENSKNITKFFFDRLLQDGYYEVISSTITSSDVTTLAGTGKQLEVEDARHAKIDGVSPSPCHDTQGRSVLARRTLQGVDLIVYGTIDSFQISSTSSSVIPKGGTKTEQVLSRTGEVSISVQVFSTTKNRIIWDRAKTVSKKSAKILEPGQSPRGDLSSDNEFLLSLAKELTATLADEISPHRGYKKRNLLYQKMRKFGDDRDLNNQAVEMANKGKWDKAKKFWKKALFITGANATVHYNLAVTYEREKKYAKAREEYETAIELEPYNKTFSETFSDFQRTFIP